MKLHVISLYIHYIHTRPNWLCKLLALIKITVKNFKNSNCWSFYKLFTFLACLAHDIRRLVYTSSNNVVFGGEEISNGDETLPYLPLNKVNTRIRSLFCVQITDMPLSSKLNQTQFITKSLHRVLRHNTSYYSMY